LSSVDELQPFVALTGAGISAESGIPTFRGDGGIWEQYRATELATPESFERDPELVWRFYNWRRELVSNCLPNQAHRTLAAIEIQLSDFTLITQNIDGLHQEAGSRQVIELHGSIWRLRCNDCGHKWQDMRSPIPEPVPTCPACSGLARPDVVWFGESLDFAVLQRAHQLSTRAKRMLVIGTSAVVYPAAELPLLGKTAGARLIEINVEDTPLTPFVDEKLRGPATKQLAAWWVQQVGKID
jgi:NAD-dependent deacetylase